MSEANTLANLVVWSDIPVADLDRAAAFYGAVLAQKVQKEEYQGSAFCVFQHSEGNGGCLVVKPEDVTAGGTLNYFNVDGRIQDALAKVAAHGGKVLEPVHPIGPYGFRATVLDSEGNRLALHATRDA
jgi:predicted enzyme related to lactoylglutathione lyase